MSFNAQDDQRFKTRLICLSISNYVIPLLVSQIKHLQISFNEQTDQRKQLKCLNNLLWKINKHVIPLSPPPQVEHVRFWIGAQNALTCLKLSIFKRNRTVMFVVFEHVQLFSIQVQQMPDAWGVVILWCSKAALTLYHCPVMCLFIYYLPS